MTEQTLIRIPMELKKRLLQYCLDEDTSMREVIEELLDVQRLQQRLMSGTVQVGLGFLQ